LPEEIVGQFVTDLAMPTTAVAAQSALEVLTRGVGAETFGWAIRKDGSRFWANEVTIPIRDNAGRTTGFARVIRDLTAWRAAEEERDRVFMLSGDLICVAGFDGLFKRVNPSFTRILGYPEPDLLAKPFVEFIHPDDVIATQAEAAEIAKGDYEGTKTFQNRYRHANGSYRWIEWKSTAVASERLIYALGRDVTEHKNFERKLQENADELERSNGDLQQFAYLASHDLQEPLRAVAGCVQMLGERNVGKLDERSSELMRHAIDGAKRMQALINDLLAYSRVGSKGISKTWIDSRAVVEKALRQVDAAIVEGNAKITVDPLPKIFADPVQLAQLFQNLIANGIKFHGPQRPEIRISAEEASGETIFSIRDNGIGISPEYHDRLFVLFQRLNRRKDYSGTGVGLAICKKIVERHGGRIWIESQPGEGANFRFTIPAGEK
jgi:PAS domain S-box-containing protein